MKKRSLLGLLLSRDACWASLPVCELATRPSRLTRARERWDNGKLVVRIAARQPTTRKDRIRVFCGYLYLYCVKTGSKINIVVSKYRTFCSCRVVSHQA